MTSHYSSVFDSSPDDDWICCPLTTASKQGTTVGDFTRRKGEAAFTNHRVRRREDTTCEDNKLGVHMSRFSKAQSRETSGTMHPTHD